MVCAVDVVVVDESLTFLEREPGFGKDTVESWVTVASFTGALGSMLDCG